MRQLLSEENIIRDVNLQRKKSGFLDGWSAGTIKTVLVPLEGQQRNVDTLLPIVKQYVREGAVVVLINVFLRFRNPHRLLGSV